MSVTTTCDGSNDWEPPFSGCALETECSFCHGLSFPLGPHRSRASFTALRRMTPWLLVLLESNRNLISGGAPVAACPSTGTLSATPINGTFYPDGRRPVNHPGWWGSQWNRGYCKPQRADESWSACKRAVGSITESRTLTTDRPLPGQTPGHALMEGRGTRGQQGQH